MRITNNNFRLRDLSKTKKPYYVLELSWDNANTDKTYLTSHDYAEVPYESPSVFRNVLDISSSTSQKINPIQAVSTIGTLNFSIQDNGFTEILNEKSRLSVIYGDSNISFASSSKEITNTGGYDFTIYKNKKNIVITNTTSNNGTYTIASVTSTTIVVNEALVNESNTSAKIDGSQDSLRRRRVRVYLGYPGLVWDDYVLLQTQLVDNVSFDKTKYLFKCSDIQRSEREKIFKLNKTNLAVRIKDPVQSDNISVSGAVLTCASNNLFYDYIAGDKVYITGFTNTANNGFYELQSNPTSTTVTFTVSFPWAESAGARIKITPAQVWVDNTSSFEMIQHGASYSHLPNVNQVGYAKIGDMVFSYQGITSIVDGQQTFDSCILGVLNTESVGVSLQSGGSTTDVEVEEFVYLEMPAIKLAYALSTGKLRGAQPTPGSPLPSNWHLGIDESLFSLAHFEGIGSDIWDITNDNKGISVRFLGLSDIDGKSFIEKELTRLTGTFRPVLSTGQLALKRMAIVQKNAYAVRTLDNDTVVSYSNLTYAMDQIHNNIKVSWNWDFIYNKYTRNDTYLDSNSINIHGKAPELEIKFKGLSGYTHTDVALSNRINSAIDRYAGPPLLMSIECTPDMTDLEVGDVIRLDIPEIKDFSNNNLQLKRSFEIQGKSVDLNTGRPSLNLFGSSDKPLFYSLSQLSNDLDNSFYTSEGIDLSGVAEYSGGTLTGYNFTGHETLTNSSAIYYHIGDLTMVNCIINKNVQLRIAGVVTSSGLIDGIGNGLAGMLDSEITYSTENPLKYYNKDNVGASGGIGTTKAQGSTDIVIRKISTEKADGSYIDRYRLDYRDDAEAATTTPYGTYTVDGEDYNTYNGSVLEKIAITNNSTSIDGLPTDLRGSAGGIGGQLSLSMNTVIQAYLEPTPIDYNAPEPEVLEPGVEPDSDIDLFIPDLPDIDDISVPSLPGLPSHKSIAPRSLASDLGRTTGPFFTNGGEGGASGAGLLIICRGMIPKGEIDLSGTPGSAGLGYTISGEEFGPAYSGSGAGGAGGGLMVLIDGNTTNIPTINEYNFTSYRGSNNPIHQIIDEDAMFSLYAPSYQGFISEDNWEAANLVYPIPPVETPVPDVTPFAGLPASLTLSITTDVTVNASGYHICHLQASVTPPTPIGNYSYSEIYLTVGGNKIEHPIIAQNAATIALPSDGAVVNVKAVSISTEGTPSGEFITESITLPLSTEAILTSPNKISTGAGVDGSPTTNSGAILSSDGLIVYEDNNENPLMVVDATTGKVRVYGKDDQLLLETGQLSVVVPIVTGLSCSNGVQVENSIFEYASKDILLKWNEVATSVTELTDDSVGDEHIADWWLLGYRIILKDTSGTVIKEDFVVTNSYTFTYEENANTGLNREIDVLVYAVSIYEDQSYQAAKIRVENPVISGNASGLSVDGGYEAVNVRFTAPPDVDYDKCEIFLDTSQGFSPSASNSIGYIAGRNVDVQLNYLASGARLSSGTTYFVIIRFYDTFGTTYYKQSSEFSVVTNKAPTDKYNGVSEWAKRIDVADKAWIDTVLGSGAISSTRIENLTAAKITSGIIDVTVGITVDGLITVNGTSDDLRIGPHTVNSITRVLSFGDGTDTEANYPILIDASGNASFRGSITVGTGSNVDPGADNTGNKLASLSSPLPNWNFEYKDVDGLAAGIRGTKDITDRSGIQYTEGADTYITLSHASDTIYGYSFPAFQVDGKTRMKFIIRHKQDGTVPASSTWVYIDYLRAQLPQGKTHIGSGTYETMVAARTGGSGTGVTPTTSWSEHTVYYTPNSLDEYISLNFYRSTGGATGTWDIESVQAYIIPKTANDIEEDTTRKWASESGADVTKTIIDGGLITTGGIQLSGTSGYIRAGQTAYNTGTGFWLGNVSSSPRFSIGNGVNKFLIFDGTDVKLGRDTKLLGSDSYNNDNIYYHSLTDSLDPYDVFTAGSGTAQHTTSSGNRVILTVDTGTTDRVYITNYLSNTITAFTWGKSRKFKVKVSLSGTIGFTSSRTMFVGSGAATGTRIGFYANGSSNNIFGYSYNGTSTTTSDLGVAWSNSSTLLEYVFTTGSKIEFYVNGSYMSGKDITTNLPSGTPVGYNTLLVADMNNNSVAQSSSLQLHLGEYKFLQDE